MLKGLKTIAIAGPRTSASVRLPKRSTLITCPDGTPEKVTPVPDANPPTDWAAGFYSGVGFVDTGPLRWWRKPAV